MRTTRSIRRGVRSLVASGAVLLTAAAPVAPDDTTGRPLPAPAGPSADVTIEVHADRAGGSPVGSSASLGALFDDAVAAGRPLTVDDLLASVGGTGTLAPDGSDPTTDTWEPQPDPWPMNAGDLDGDGLDDVYVRLYGPGIEGLEARRGNDGTLLWSLEDEDADLFPVPVGDLDGDGIPDLLIHAFRGWSEHGRGFCGLDWCSTDAAHEGTWVYGLASGADGSIRWTRELPTAFEDVTRHDLVLDERTRTIRGSNVRARLLPAGDVDGDGQRDLVLETVHLVDATFRSRWVGHTEVGGWSWQQEEGRWATSVELLDVSGRYIRTLADADGPTELSVELVADLSGDGRDDILLDTETTSLRDRDCIDVRVAGIEHCDTDETKSEHRFRRGAVDGTGSRLWEVDAHPFSRWFIHAFPDVDGDGGLDLLDPIGLGDAMEMRSGTTGELLWSSPSPDNWDPPLEPAGDVDADGIEDLVRVSVPHADSCDRIEVSVERLSGRDGSIIVDRRHVFTSAEEDCHVGFEIWVGHELDGVPGTDLVVQETVDGLRTVRFERGIDGATIAVTADRGHVALVDDLDGDGVDDTVLEAHPFRTECETVDGDERCQDVQHQRITALTLPDLRPLWRWEPDPATSVALLETLEVDGSPGAELLVRTSRWSEDQSWWSRGYEVRSGSDNAVVWAR